jgi:hypothetical protein
MSLKRAVICQYRPAPPADLITLVVTLPAELHAGTSVTLARAAVHPPPDGYETELAGPVVTELDEAGRYQVDGLLIPQVHLYDPPPAMQPHDSFLSHHAGGRRFPRDQSADAGEATRPGGDPYEQPGRHRRILFSDLLRYVEQRHEERTAALDRMTEEASAAGTCSGRPEDYAGALKKARQHPVWNGAP